jgi:hypothetical protein
LFYFCGGEPYLYRKYFALLKKVENKYIFQEKNVTSTELLIFSRPSNLLALQEIINHQYDVPLDKFELSLAGWENILKYYLCINSVTGSTQEEDKEQKSEGDQKEVTEKEDNFIFSNMEIIAAEHAFVNELKVVLNPIFSFDRFSKWIDRIIGDSELTKFIASYFYPAGFDVNFFLTRLCYILVQKDDNLIGGCGCILDSNDKASISFFDNFSQRYGQPITHKWDLSEIRNGPIYKWKEGHYLILDKIFLMEKVYEQFINDFFNIYLVDNDVNIGYYRGKFGGFFEQYIADIFTSIFSPRKHAVLKTLDELKINIKAGEYEIADIFVRENKKIFIAQIKSSGLRNIQFSGNPNAFFTDKNGDDPEFFYKNFGLFQLIESIKFLENEIIKIDTKFPLGKKIEIFPALIVNEKLFYTPILPTIINDKFRERLPSSINKKFIIHPVTVIHVEELERLKNPLINKKIDFWRLFRSHYRNTLLDRPFKITIDRINIDQFVDLKGFSFFKYINFAPTNADNE